MATKRESENSRAHKRYPDYIDGNTVRKLGVEEPIRRREPEHEEQPRRSRHAAPEPKRSALNFPFVMFLVAVAAVAVYFCISYLGIQSQISQTRSSISSLESSIDSLKVQNDSIDYEINAYMDIDYIIQQATEELGMVLADKDQVSLYDQTEKEYMKQYDDID